MVHLRSDAMNLAKSLRRTVFAQGLVSAQKQNRHSYANDHCNDAVAW